MNNQNLDEILYHWRRIHETIGFDKIADDEDYDKATSYVNHLLEDGANEEKHRLHEFFLYLTNLIWRYDQKHYPQAEVTGVEMLKFLMKQHGLVQADLADELGSQSVVSEILSGKRDLNIRQMKALASRFNTNPSIFF